MPKGKNAIPGITRTGAPDRRVVAHTATHRMAAVRAAVARWVEARDTEASAIPLVDDPDDDGAAGWDDGDEAPH